MNFDLAAFLEHRRRTHDVQLKEEREYEGNEYIEDSLGAPLEYDTEDEVNEYIRDSLGVCQDESSEKNVMWKDDFNALVWYNDLLECAKKKKQEIREVQLEFNAWSTVLLDIKCIRKYLFSGSVPNVFNLYELALDIRSNMIHHVNLSKTDKMQLCEVVDRMFHTQSQLCMLYYTHYGIIRCVRDLASGELKHSPSVG
jgi:hypothetical protein